MRRILPIVVGFLVIGAGTATAAPVPYNNTLTISFAGQQVVSRTAPGVANVTTFPSGHPKTISFPSSFSATGTIIMLTDPTGPGTHYWGYKLTAHQGPQTFTGTTGSAFNIFGTPTVTGNVARCGLDTLCTSANTTALFPFTITFTALSAQIQIPSHLIQTDRFILTHAPKVIDGQPLDIEHEQHVVPEASTMLLLGGGFLVLSAARRRRSKD